MIISTKGRYATRAMMELAVRQAEQPVRLKDIAEAQGLSLKYLENLFRELKKAKLVVSVVGKNGGYRLARAAEQIKVLEIVEAMEGDIVPVDCVRNEKYCKQVDQCVTRVVWEKLGEAIKKELGSTTIQDLVTECLKKRAAKSSG